MRSLAVACSFALLAAPLTGQTGQILVDFGSPTATTGAPWNDVHTDNVSDSHALVYDDGTASGIQLDFTPGKTTSTANTAGVSSPTPGSPLDGLGWPANALRDTLYAQGTAEVELTLSGLDPTATYDFTIVASRVGVSDVRTAVYTAAGANVGSAVLDAANNTTDFVSIRGIRPDAGSAITLAWRAAPTNTNANKFFYVNALGIAEWSGGTQPPLVAFSTNRTDLSRVQGKGPFAASLATYTNDGSAPAVLLDAVDDATQAPPTWLTVPAATTAGASLPFTVDADALAVGTYSATLSAQAAGYDGAVTAVVLDVRAAGGYRNYLFYGNSYTIQNGGVHTLVKALAEQAGLPSPNVVDALVGGQTLNFHLTDPGQAAAITQSLPLGEEWDFVVMQGFSLEATVNAGDPAQFLADALAIYTNVRAHSPGARACMFQTWARGQGNPLYPGTFTDPLEMHQQVEASYAQAVADIDAAFGPGSAVRAAAGEAVALRNFDPVLYDPDLSHPRPMISVMAASAIFTATYGQRVCDLDVDPGVPTSLVTKLQGFGLTEADWREAAGLADRSADAANRLHPGSGEDLLLRSGEAFPLAPCPLEGYAPGTRLNVRLMSPIGTYDGAEAVVWADLYAPANPPASVPGAPEIQYDPGSAWVLASTPSLGGVFTTDVVITPWMAGRRLLVQGCASAPSAVTGNPFTTTDAHEIRVGPVPRAAPVLLPPPPPTPGG